MYVTPSFVRVYVGTPGFQHDSFPPPFLPNFHFKHLTPVPHQLTLSAAANAAVTPSLIPLYC